MIMPALIAANTNTPPPPAEQVLDNVFWRGAAARISICVPAYRYDVSALIAALAECDDAGLVEIIVHDDGARDHELLARMQYEASRQKIAVRLVAANTNRGRAAARNAAIAHARADWVLLLDADMLPDGPQFLTRYLDAIESGREPCVVVGGYSLQLASKDARNALHRWQAEASECLPAAQRQAAPGRYVFSSNVLAHRSVVDTIRLTKSLPDGAGKTRTGAFAPQNSIRSGTSTIRRRILGWIRTAC